MSTTIKQPTLAEFKAWAKDNHNLALAVCKAQAYAEIMREKVDSYIQPIFDSYTFYVEPKWNELHGEERITDRKNLYLTDLNDPQVAAFYDDCDKAHRAHGFKGPKGHCPALVAETLLTEAEGHLLDSGSELLGLDDCRSLYGEERKKMLKLLIGACLKKGE